MFKNAQRRKKLTELLRLKDGALNDEEEISVCILISLKKGRMAVYFM